MLASLLTAYGQKLGFDSPRAKLDLPGIIGRWSHPAPESWMGGCGGGREFALVPVRRAHGCAATDA